jgi:pSer/pThr/pTyr-binding forkhead associated (FHA) protein
MSLRLEVIAGNAAGGEIEVDDELVIGRHAEGAGRLSEDSEISRHHARLAREVSGDYAIEDLGSSNGTFVNGLRLAAPQLLAEGDSIEVGATTLLVRSIAREAAATQAPAPPPAPTAAPTIFARAPVVAEDAIAAEPASATADTANAAADTASAAADTATAYEDATEESTLQAPSSLKLTLEVDFEAREATVALGDGTDEAVRLVLEDGRWRTRRAED